MDGTIIDTEPVWFWAEASLVRAHGGIWSTREAQHMVGNDLRTVAARLQRAGVDRPVAEIVDILENRVAAGITDVNWRPGALQLISALSDAGIRQALVTMAWSTTATAVLNKLPHNPFEVVITGDTVVCGKPHPEPYRTATEALGVTAEHCVAIEDSPTGAASATAAGIHTLVVPGHVHVDIKPGQTHANTLKDVTVEHLKNLLHPS